MDEIKITTDDLKDAPFMGTIKSLSLFIGFALQAWGASLIWNAWLADSLGIDFYLTFPAALMLALFMRLLTR